MATDSHPSGHRFTWSARVRLPASSSRQVSEGFHGKTRDRTGGDTEVSATCRCRDAPIHGSGKGEPTMMWSINSERMPGPEFIGEVAG